jgi:hypothetical protein
LSVALLSSCDLPLTQTSQPLWQMDSSFVLLPLQDTPADKDHHRTIGQPKHGVAAYSNTRLRPLRPAHNPEHSDDLQTAPATSHQPFLTHAPARRPPAAAPATPACRTMDGTATLPATSHRPQRTTYASHPSVILLLTFVLPDSEICGATPPALLRFPYSYTNEGDRNDNTRNTPSYPRAARPGKAP